MEPELPYLTPEVAPIAGRIKQRPEDFVVEEIPAYEASGEGDHVYFQVEKIGISTHDAVKALARALGVAPREIGYAGLKDAQALARQIFSLEHADPDRIAALEMPRLRVVWVSRHRNKLRIGHLAGNRFVLKLRGIPADRHGDVRAVLDVVERRGVPNYFGEQRFGARGDTWRIGRALLLRDAEEAVSWMAGRPGPADTGKVLRAREHFDAGDYERAEKAWPGGFRDAIRLCRAMARSKGDAKRALRVIDRSLLRLYTAAYHAWLFNQVLAERMGELDRVLVGDLAWKHDNGAVFEVLDAEAEAPRAARFEISPSGPLFGRRTSLPGGRPGELERGVLARAGHALEDFARTGPLEWKGGRRPLRFRPERLAVSAGADDAGEFLEIAFELPPGCYATSLLREVLKPPRPSGLSGDSSPELPAEQ